jgi:hypothetical protein
MATIKSVAPKVEVETTEVEEVAEVKEAAPAPKEAPKKEVSWFLKDAK